MRDKILTVMVCGGIGNQLFCYAHAYSYARSHGLSLKLDLLDYDAGYFRAYQLDRLCIKYDAVTHYTLPFSIIYKTRRFMIPLLYRKYIKECRAYHYQALPDTDSMYMEGYWQCPKYFSDHIGDLRQLFTLKAEEDIKHLESFSEKLPKDSVAVHIRRGDFLKGGCCLAVEYYKNATERILREVSDPHFIIFSDDPKWVKNSFLSIFNNKNMVVSDAIEVIDDDLINIFAIASCEHQIISNSSYSWWGGIEYT